MKICDICSGTIENPKNNSKFCLPCSKDRRKQKMKEYDKNRKPENEQKSQQRRNEVRRQLRKKYQEEGLCTDCGGQRHDTLKKCLKCHEINLKASIKTNRKKGMMPAGQSSCEKMTYEILKQLTSLNIVRNTYKAIRNPKTNKALELDIYIPDINLAIEVDGPMHRVSCYGEKRLLSQIINDKIKNSCCEEKGITLIRLNTDLFSNDYIRATLSEALQNVTSDSVVENVQRLTGEDTNQ